VDLRGGAATGLGGLALLAFPRPSERLLGFTAGAMLAATGFTLLVPGLAQGGVAEVVAGFAIGGASMLFLDMAIPHAHAASRSGGTSRRSRPSRPAGDAAAGGSNNP